MNAQQPNLERLWPLFEATSLGTLSSGQREELQDLLRGNTELQRLYLEYCRMHAELRRLCQARAASAAALDMISGEDEPDEDALDVPASRNPDINGQWPVVSGRRVESRELRVESEAVFPESPDSRIPNPEIPVINLEISKSPNLQIPTLNSRLSTLNSWTFSYSVATVLLAIFLLGAWSYTFTHPDADSLATRNSRRAMHAGGAEKVPSQFTFVGRVSGMVDCQWSDEATATSPGAAVALKRRYALKSGLMEISYDSGAKVILQGPCEYTIESPRSGFLKVGKLVARVGAGGGGQGAGTNLPSPIGRGAGGEGFGRGAGGEGSQPRSQPTLTLALSGHHEVVGERGPNPESPNPRIHSPLATSHSPLFSVHTPTALVEDLGTEFGVVVSERGDCEIHVMEGKVLARHVGSPVVAAEDVQLGAGEAMRFEAELTSPARITPVTEQFLSMWNRLEARRLRRLVGNKTLVAWVTLSNLAQQGGGVISIENTPTHEFDGIAYAEIAPRKWTAASNAYLRTPRNQAETYPAETAAPDRLVQIAIVYEWNRLTIYREGKVYAEYWIDRPQTFYSDSVVLLGKRCVDRPWRTPPHCPPTLAGEIEEARLYNVALMPSAIAALKPNEPSPVKPIGQWTFEDGTARDEMGNFPPGELRGNARIADGKLVLDGKDSYLIVIPLGADPAAIPPAEAETLGKSTDERKTDKVAP